MLLSEIENLRKCSLKIKNQIVAYCEACHWIAFGCETKHQNHQESHARLENFLRRQGEGAIAEWWENLDQVRQGGWYGKNTDPVVVQYALDLLKRIHMWASQ